MLIKLPAVATYAHGIICNEFLNTLNHANEAKAMEAVNFPPANENHTKVTAVVSKGPTMETAADTMDKYCCLRWYFISSFLASDYVLYIHAQFRDGSVDLFFLLFA